MLEKSYNINQKLNPMFFLLVCPALSKEERELVRRKALKQIRVKYGLQVSLQKIKCLRSTSTP